MDCREARERLSDYQDGGLDSAAARSVCDHLRECAECAQTARSLAAVREGLRRLPPVAAPPELIDRVRDAVAREEAASPSVSPGASAPAARRSLLSRMRIPLEAAAAVLLVASIWWYQKGTPTGSVPPSPPRHTETAPSASKSATGDVAPLPEKAPKSPERETAAASRPHHPIAPGAPSGAAAGKAEFASLPPGAPEPKTRERSPAELPAAPAVRASSESARIVPRDAGPPAAAAPDVPGVAPPGFRSGAAPPPAPSALAESPSRLLRTSPYGREILLEVAAEARGTAGERIAAAARRLGGSVERIERDPPGAVVTAVRVLLPEPAAPFFLSEMERIGKVPPEEKPADADSPAGPVRGTVAYTVRIRVP